LAAEQVRAGAVAGGELVQAGRPDVRVGGRSELIPGGGRDHGRGDGGAGPAALPGDPVDVAVLDGAAQATDSGSVAGVAVGIWGWPGGLGREGEDAGLEEQVADPDDQHHRQEVVERP
jgi:hypothetical protein